MADALRKPVLMQGNEAVVAGALAAGVSFYAGYPITPSTEIAEGFSHKLVPPAGVFMQLEDEIASLGACLGASLAGAKAMTATSGPGFSLMQELIGYASMAEIPVVIVDVMRFGPSTGQPTSPSQGDVMQARWGTHGDHPVIALSASSVLGSYLQTIRAVDLSERYRVPVILLLDEVVAHMREAVTLPEAARAAGRVTPDAPPEWFKPYAATPTGVPAMAAFGSGYRHHVTGLVHDKLGFPTTDPGEMEAATKRLHDKIKRGFADICATTPYRAEDAELLLVAYGSMSRSCAEAVELLRAEGRAAGLLTLDTLWPFPRAAFERQPQTVKRMVVCEMNMGQIYREVWRVSRGRWQVSKFSSVDGELPEPSAIAARVREAAGW